VDTLIQIDVIATKALTALSIADGPGANPVKNGGFPFNILRYNCKFTQKLLLI